MLIRLFAALALLFAVPAAAQEASIASPGKVLEVKLSLNGEGRIQYTALGDAMNTAARLESANKQLKTKALFSAEARMLTTTIQVSG